MTLDEAIKHAEEVAEEKEKEAWEAQLQEEYKTIKSCKVCAKEHRQLANWLKELKLLREQKCEDAVSRQAVEKITWEEPSYTDPFNVLTEVREKVRALSPVTPQLKTRWIPVSERMPEKDEYTDFYKCMVARPYTSRSNTCDICIAYFDGKRFLSHNSHGIVSGVKAWMPLPEPYKEEGSGEE